MAEEPIQQPAAAPADTTAAPTVTPSPSNVPGGGMNLSGLSTPAQPNPTGTTEYQNAAQGENTALQNVAKLAQPTPAAPPAPHARLMAMIAGLGVGLSAFGDSIATHGQKGGAREVQDYYANQQNQKIQQQQATEAQKNAQIQQQMMVADTNHKLGQNILLLATIPNQLAKSDLDLQKDKLEVSGAQQGQSTNEAEFRAAHGGMNAQDFNTAMSGTSPVSGNGVNPFFVNSAQQTLRGAQTAGIDDKNPAFAKLKAVLASPGATPKDIYTATQQLQAEQGIQSKAVDERTKQEAAEAGAPFGDKAADLNAALLNRFKVLNPTATTLPKGYSLGPNSTKSDFDRIDKIMQQTEGAQATKANRDIVNGMRTEMLNLAKGVDIPGDDTKSGDEYIATLPAGVAGTIKAIHEGREAPPAAGSRSAAAQTILGALNHAYPDYDQTKYPAYLKARVAFTSGPEAKGVNAINTVMTHLGRMYDHATASGTSGGLTGAVTGFFGDKDVRGLDIDRTGVATELAKAYAAGQISEGEKNDWEHKLDFTSPGMTTGKLITNLKEIDTLLEGKQRAYEQQWATASPSANIVSPVPIITSEAEAARAKIRGEAPTTQPNSPSAPAPATAPTASNFVRPTGVSAGAKLMQAPGGAPHWIEPQNQKAATNHGAVEIN